MGTLVTVTSRHFLLQREDHAAALEAVRDFVRRHPADFRSTTGELKATDLTAALADGDWVATADEHGDLVALSYGGDKVPPDATDDFPMSFFEALAPFVQHAHLFRWVEGRTALMSHSLGRRGNTYTVREPGVALEQVGAPPLVRPGETAVVELRVAGHGAEGVVRNIGSSHSTQLDHRVESRDVPIGGTCRVHVTPQRGAADPAALYLSCDLDGADQFDAEVRVQVDAPREQTDALHEVVASLSPLDPERRSNRSPFLAAADAKAALERLKRYAARHTGKPGAEFLAGVLKARGLAAAFRAAQLECELTSGRAALGVRFTGDRLPGYERYLFGLFASLRGLVQGDPWFRVVYAHDPSREVVFSYEWGEPSRDLRER